MDSFLMCFSICCCLLWSADGVTLTLEINSTLPLKDSSLVLSCLISEPVNIYSSYNIHVWKGRSEFNLDRGCFGLHFVCYNHLSSSYTSNSSGLFVRISRLTREAEGTWRCTYSTYSSNSLYLTVYTIPSGLFITQDPNQNVDLSVQSGLLQCKTIGCTYPSPTVQWIFQDLTTSSENVYETSNPSATGEMCVPPEMIYTSTLNLPLYTTLNDNSDKTGTFSCRIKYTDSSRNIIAYASNTVRFAVRVTEAFLQYNNQNITSTLTVTSGEQVTLACVTGTSRPAPSIDWYIGSRSIGSGTNLIFTPSNTSHNEVIYCQAYNTDQNLKVDSNKPKLFVRVRVNEAFLQHNNQNISSTLIVTSGEQVTLTCVTGTSRPAPDVDWYKGSVLIGNGTNLTFTPTNTDHNEVIYCQVNNFDPKVDSNKPKLFVRVDVFRVILDGSAGGTFVFNEGCPQTLKCISSPSRPMPIIRWWLGNKHVMVNITNRDIIDINEMHVLTSEITLVVMRNISNQRVYCEGFISDQGTTVESTQVNVDVLYAPDVRVNISGYTVAGSTAVLMCAPQGKPPQYTFHPWIHMVGQTEIRRLAGVNMFSFSTLPLSNINIQDMGTYICTVDNSITGLDGQINQRGDTLVYVQGPPVIGETQSTFTGETNKSASIEIPFYSYLSIKTVKFSKRSVSFEMSNTSDVSIYTSPSNITMMFYKMKVMMSGYVAVLHFRNLKDTDFDNYTLQISNDLGSVSLQFDLTVSAPPSMPKKVFFSHVEDGLLVFGIEKGFNGGYEQTFIVEYQPFGLPDTAWSTIFKINETDLDDPFTNGTYYIKIPKIEDGQYVFRVYAENRKGNSSALEGVHVQIETAPPSMPKKVFFSHVEDGLLVFGIEKGFNGGYEQTFIVEYQPFGLPDTAWSTIFKINETDLDDPFTNGTYYIKVPKIEDGQYVFRVYAENRKGNSSALEGVHVQIETAPSTDKNIVNLVPAIAGGVSARFVVILNVTIGVFLRRRNRHPKETDQNITLENNRNTSFRPTDGDLYEKLNSNANSDIQTYSSLNIQTPFEGSLSINQSY